MAKCDWGKFIVPDRFTIINSTAVNETTAQKMDKAIRKWICTNLTYPCTWIGRYHFTPLREQVQRATDDSTISDEEIMECLERIRDQEWPEMAYRKGLVPIFHQPSGAVWARPPHLVAVYVREGEDDNIHHIIPRNGSIKEMEDRFWNPPKPQAPQVPMSTSKIKKKLQCVLM